MKQNNGAPEEVVAGERSEGEESESERLARETAEKEAREAAALGARVQSLRQRKAALDIVGESIRLEAQMRELARNNIEVQELLRTPSVGTPEFTKKIESLDISVPDGETLTEREVSSLIEARSRNLRDEIIETRFEIPSERDAVISELIKEHGLSLSLEDSIKKSGTDTWEGTRRAVSEQLTALLADISICNKNPQIQTALRERLVRDALLLKNASYQREKRDREAHQDRLTAYAEAEAALPAFLEFLNDAFAPLFDVLRNLEPDALQEILKNESLQQALSHLEIDFSQMKVTGVRFRESSNSPHMRSGFPSVESIEDTKRVIEDSRQSIKNSASLIRKSFDNPSYELSGEEKSQIRRGNSIANRLREISTALRDQERVEREGRHSEEYYAESDRALAKNEDVARTTATHFIEYADAAERIQSVADIERKIDRLTTTLTTLKIPIERLAHNQDSFTVGRRRELINLSEKKREIERLRAERTALETKKQQRLETLQALGARPKVLFSGDKAKAWDASRADLQLQIGALENKIEKISEDIRHVDGDVSKQFGVTEDLTRLLPYGEEMTGEKISLTLSEEARTLRTELGELETAMVGLRRDQKVVEQNGHQRLVS